MLLLFDYSFCFCPIQLKMSCFRSFFIFLIFQMYIRVYILYVDNAVGLPSKLYRISMTIEKCCEYYAYAHCITMSLNGNARCEIRTPNVITTLCLVLKDNNFSVLFFCFDSVSMRQIVEMMSGIVFRLNKTEQ